jgi:Spy/CpxP family protein refolding chaperone
MMDRWAVLDGVSLTEDQKTKVEALQKEAREKVLALLTPEQKQQLKQSREQRREHKPEGK